MKKIILLALAFNGVNVYAAENGFCKELYDYAEMSMEQRQKGTPLKVMYETLDKIKPTPSQKKLFTFIINDAYRQPKYSSKDNQKEAINEFAKDQYFLCLAATGKDS